MDNRVARFVLGILLGNALTAAVPNPVVVGPIPGVAGDPVPLKAAGEAGRRTTMRVRSSWSG